MKSITNKLICLLILNFIILSCSNLYAENRYESIENLINDTNDYIEKVYGVKNYYPLYVVVKGRKHYVNFETYKKYRIIAYFSDNSLNLINAKKDIVTYKGKKIYRYVGYDRTGKKLYNTKFPADIITVLYDKGDYKVIKDATLKNITYKSKDRLISNFLKSSTNSIKNALDLYVKVRNKNLDKDLFLNSWKNYLKIKDRSFWEKVLEISSLPSPYTNGVVVLRRNGYYFTVNLDNEADTNINLKVKHLIINDNKDSYFVKGKLGRYDYNFVLKDGEKVNIKADDISPYNYKGFLYLDEPLKSKQILKSKVLKDRVFSKQLKYKDSFSKRTLIFLYENNSKLNDKIFTKGNIEISSKNYNVEKAIPSSEYVSINALADSKYLAKFYVNTVNRNLNVNLYFEGVSKPITKKISYSYNLLNQHFLLGIKSFVVENQKINNLKNIYMDINTSFKFDIKNYDKHLKVDLKYDEKFKVKRDKNNLDIFVAMPKNIYVSKSERDKIASNILNSIKIKVRNDKIFIENQKILDDSYTNKALGINKLKPLKVSVKKRVQILPKIKNGIAATNGKIVYKSLSGYTPKVLSFVDANIVSVHTPVYNSSSLKSNAIFDQRPNNKKVKPALVLDAVSTLNLSSFGKHINSKGYKTRDYNKYVKKKVVVFPIDVYVSKIKSDLTKSNISKKFFYKKNSKISLDKNIKKIYVKPAFWNITKDYNIKVDYIAINSDEIREEKIANLNIHNNTAKKKIKITLTGRLFDFIVESVKDKRFINSRKFFTVGKFNKNGLIRKRYKNFFDEKINSYTLPVCSPQNKNIKTLENSVKVGYPFIFSIKSLGNFRDKDDIIVARPKFIYVSKSGKVRDDVKLFYTDKENKMIYESLSQEKAIDEKLKLSTLSLYKRLYPQFSNIREIDYKLITGSKTFRFNSDVSISSSAFRVFLEPKTKDTFGNELLSKSAYQKWYFKYAIPNNVVAFLPNKSDKFNYLDRLKDGYIGVSFIIGISKNGKNFKPILTYKSKTHNQWTLEGYKSKIVDTKMPIVIFYNLSKNSYTDFRKR